MFRAPLEPVRMVACHGYDVPAVTTGKHGDSLPASAGAPRAARPSGLRKTASVRRSLTLRTCAECSAWESLHTG